jgi:predicted nucleotidyltransferase
MSTSRDILATLRRERGRLFARYGLKSMALFGSATRGDLRPDSDVDIMVEFQRPVGMEFIDLAEELERLVARKVDLVMRSAVKPHYMTFIERDLIDV